MKTETIVTYSKKELETKYTVDSTRFDVALASHMDKLDKASKAIKAEMDAVKAIAKTVFGTDGGNDVFTTETRVSYLINEADLLELIGAEKLKQIKNKPSVKTYVHW